jgi:hypothetical protein
VDVDVDVVVVGSRRSSRIALAVAVGAALALTAACGQRAGGTAVPVPPEANWPDAGVLAPPAAEPASSPDGGQPG